MRKAINLLFIVSGVIVFVACKKDAPTNRPPTAIAGPDHSITLPTDSVLLDGSISRDPDGTIIAWLWKKISGSGLATFSNSSGPKTAVRNLQTGAYQFELTITDNGGLSAKDTVMVVVNDPAQPNRPPVANAGADQEINTPQSAVFLNGRGSTDPDNNIASYSWSKIGGPSTFNIVAPNVAETQVLNLLEGIYLFELKVTDAGALFAKDTVQITVNPPPAPCDNTGRPQIMAQLIPIGLLSQARVGMTVASAGSKIVFAGATLAERPGSSVPEYGSSRVDIYDIITQTWSTAELSASRSDIAAVALGNKIFFAGGRLGDGAFDQLFSTVDIYDVSTNTWTVASLSQPRAYVSAAAIGNNVFFAGGEMDWDYNTSDRVDIYDVSRNTWSTAILSQPRAYISSIAVNNKVYFAGGHVEDRWYANPSNKIDIYDISTNTWTVSTLSQPMGSPGGISVADNIYWTEGCTVEIKNLNTWTSSFAYLSRPNGWVNVEGHNVVIKNNKLVFYRYAGSDLNKFDIYDLTTNTWSIGVLPQNNVAYSSIFSVNNTIFVAGGAVNGTFSSLSNQVWKLEF